MHNAMSSLISLGSNRSRLVSQRLSAKLPSVAANSQHQRQAAAALSDYSDEHVLAWLKLVRSARNIEPIPEPCPGDAYLTPSQIQALVTLKDCPNNRVQAYLLLARRDRLSDDLAVYNRNADGADKGNGPTSATPAPGPTYDLGLSNNPSPFITPSDPSLFETGVQTQPSQEQSSSPGLSPYGRRQSATDDLDLFAHHTVRSVNSNLSTPAANHYWCTVCEIPKPYKDSGSWKKHEKEHETTFVCQLDSAAHPTMADQTPGTRAFSCKRRDIMVNHLNKSHGTPVQEGRVLADQWRFTVEKQAWSCGFCGSFFLDFKDRLRHIDIEHFRKYESMRQWDFNMVVRGLLMQPKMKNAWKKRTASLSPWVQSEDLIWTKDFARNMRLQLEIGPSNESDANRLADEVYIACKPKEYLNESAMDPTTVSLTGIPGAGSLLSPNQYQAGTARNSRSAPDYSQRRSIMHATANINGDSPFDQSPRHAYDHDSRAAPSVAPFEEGRQGTYNPQCFYPAQDWVAESEGDIGCSSFDDAMNEIPRGFSWSSIDWNGQ